MAFHRSPSTTGRTRRVQMLEYAIAESRRLRPLLSDPDHVAVVMQRHARRTLIGLWIFLCLGLVFTITGVQRFLTAGTTPGDPLWWAAWCVEPMFAGLLITLLNFEAVILSHGVAPGHAWWSRLKHTLLASTLAMNVIPQLAPLVGDGAFNLGSLAVHAIVPLIVYGVAEVIPLIQARTQQIIQQVNEQTDDQPTDAQSSRKDAVATTEPATAAPSPGPEQDTDPEAASPHAPEPTRPPLRSAPPPAPESAPMRISHSAPEAYAPEPPSAAQTTAPDIADLAAVRSLKLPDSVVAKLRTAYDGAAAQGREVTTSDVQQAVKLPDAMAQRIVAELTGHNGHPVATP